MGWVDGSVSGQECLPCKHEEANFHQQYQEWATIQLLAKGVL